MRDFAIQLTHRPGELARVAHALARKGVNLKSIAAMAFQHQGLVHLLPDDTEAARSALREANINVQAIYVVGLDGDLVDLALAVDDPKKAKKLLE